MVANYIEGGKRRFDSYADEADALEAAETLAKRLDARDYVAANLTRDQAAEYANAVKRLEPFNVTVDAVTASAAGWLKSLGDLANIGAAVRFYAQRHRQITPKRVADVVAELLKVKESRKASNRYLGDLRARLGRFAEAFSKATSNVTTAEIQEWLDGLKLSTQSYRNFQTVLNLFFEFAVSRGYASDNPVEGTERVKVRSGDIEIFTPAEMSRLLAAADPQFLPCLLLGAFAGLRSAEVERLEWSDVHFAESCVVVAASKSKTASRRIVPIHNNLAIWLAPYADQQGKLWPHSSIGFHKTQESTAAATAVEPDEEKGVKGQKAVKWRQNGLRHSYASYRFAQTGDAGRVAGELGNSAAVVHRHYRELVKPADAERWFNIRPDSPANVLTLPTTAKSATVATTTAD
jgi:integrase